MTLRPEKGLVSSEIPKSKPGRPARQTTDPLGPDDGPTVTNNVTGRVKFDDRGNAVWEWAVGTGKFGSDVSSSRLKKLDNPELAIIDDAPPPVRLVNENAHGTDLGYSPYDSGLLGSTDVGRKETTRRKDLKRLGEWLKLKKQAEANKRGGK